MFKKILYLLASFTLLVACTKTTANNSNNNGSGGGGNTVTALAYLTGNVTNGIINIGVDTPNIYINITGTVATALYTITANDTMLYNNNRINPNATIITGVKQGNYTIRYTSNTPNNNKQIIFTITDNLSNKTTTAPITFNVKWG